MNDTELNLVDLTNRLDEALNIISDIYPEVRELYKSCFGSWFGSDDDIPEPFYMVREIFIAYSALLHRLEIDGRKVTL